MCKEKVSLNIVHRSSFALILIILTKAKKRVILSLLLWFQRSNIDEQLKFYKNLPLI